MNSIDITYSFFFENAAVVFTNNRNDVVDMISAGHNCVLCPQMFAEEKGYYGVEKMSDLLPVSKEAAELRLSEIERHFAESYCL